MWAFVFILAMVPLLFFWTDDLGTLFPQWKEHLPSSNTSATATASASSASGATASGATATLFPDEVGRWHESHGEQGASAWAISNDRKYRLAAGCLAGKKAAIQVIDASGRPAPGMLNYGYGQLPLTQGTHISDETISAVAQFGKVQVVHNEMVLTEFNVPSSYSAIVARALSNHCQ